MSHIADVAIVGYGPVGQALALNLLQHGHRVVVIERWSALYALPRAVSYDHEAARILQALGVADALRPHTCFTDTYEWRNAAQQTLVEYTGCDDIAISGWPRSIGFHQPSLEAVLDGCIRRHGAQVELLQGWEALALEESPNHVSLRLRSAQAPSAASRTVQARYVVGCDGAGSFVRQAMGSHYENLDFAADWLVVNIKPKDPARCDQRLVQICDPSRPTTLVTGGPGRRRLEFMLLPGEDRAAMNTEAQAWRLVAMQGWTPDNAELERHAVYTFRAALADCWQRGRVLLAGDAAHLTPPFAAQGLCAGLRDVQALAWRLDQVLNGVATPALLDSYEAERAPHARELIEFAVALGRVSCVLDPEEARRRDQRILAGARSVASSYPLPRLGISSLQDNADPHAGRLALQARVRVGERVGLFDDVIGHGFALLTLDDEAGLSDEQRNFLAAIGAHVISFGAHGTVRDIDGSYRRWFAELGCRTVLVRPDFYLFGTGVATALVEALRRCPVWHPTLLSSTKCRPHYHAPAA